MTKVYSVDITDLLPEDVEEYLSKLKSHQYSKRTVPYIEKTPEEVFAAQHAPEVLRDQVPDSRERYDEDEFKERVEKEGKPGKYGSCGHLTHQIKVHHNPNGAVSERLFNRVGYHAGFGAANGLQRMLRRDLKRRTHHFIDFTSSSDAMMFKMSCRKAPTR